MKRFWCLLYIYATIWPSQIYRAVASFSYITVFPQKWPVLCYKINFKHLYLKNPMEFSSETFYEQNFICFLQLILKISPPRSAPWAFLWNWKLVKMQFFVKIFDFPFFSALPVHLWKHQFYKKCTWTYQWY